MTILASVLFAPSLLLPAGRMAAHAPWRAAVQACAPAAEWDAMLRRLRGHKAEWGNADATLGTDLGRWCATQRRARERGALAPEREAALDSLGFSWSSPTSPDVLETCDWDEMMRRLRLYGEAHGDMQVPKKYKLDPQLGGWVAAVRRTRGDLGADVISQLDAAGFEWVSTRQCGSAFMVSFRELRDFWSRHGHTDVARALAEGGASSEAAEAGSLAEMARWCDAQRKANAKGMLSAERQAYLSGIGFDWEIRP